jgi:two-component system chemotaxis sensor kinase CheA
MEHNLLSSSEDEMNCFLSKGYTVSVHDNGEHILELFSTKEDLEGVVVLDQNIPVGLIMRTYFFQKLGSKYGLALYSKRSLSILMDTKITCADHKEPIETISKLATERDHQNLYDDIIITKQEEYYGVISIRQFLLQLSEQNRLQVIELKQQNEKEMRLRKSLEEKTRAINDLLNHAGQGFLSFGSDLIIKEEYSAECVSIFGREIAKQNYLALLSPFLSEGKEAVMQTVLSSFFQSNQPTSEAVYLSLLPSEACIDEKEIAFSYKRIHDGDNKHVMVVLTDITEKKQMEQTLEQEKIQQRLVFKAIVHKEEIIQLIRDLQEAGQNGFGFQQGSRSPKEFLLELFRVVHTFKGEFAQHGFHHTMEGLHEIESEIDAQLQSQDLTEAAAAQLVLKLCSRNFLEKDLEIIEGFLGTSYLEEEQRFMISSEQYQRVFEELMTYAPKDAYKNIEKAYSRLTHKDLKAALLQYKDYVTYLAGRLNKREPSFTVTGDGIFIDPNQYGPVLKNLIHLFRNSMDHGIESEEDRLIQGKDPEGSILCHIADLGTAFSIEIHDDGKGIDLTILTEKALEKGLITQEDLAAMEDSERLNLVFLDNLSSKEGVSQISGRGIGMSSLKQACLRLGGCIHVTSQPLAGTTFTITLPY